MGEGVGVGKGGEVGVGGEEEGGRRRREGGGEGVIEGEGGVRKKGLKI